MCACRRSGRTTLASPAQYQVVSAPTPPAPHDRTAKVDTTNDVTGFTNVMFTTTMLEFRIVILYFAEMRKSSVRNSHRFVFSL